MKKLNLLMVLCSLFITISLMESCVEDPCDDVNCGDFGTCLLGTCLCDDGYELATDGTCNTMVREKFMATYNADETCTNGTDNYSTTISAASTGIRNIVISNFYNFGSDVNAVINTDGKTFTIESQSFGNDTLSGSGVINTDTGVVTLTYTLEGSSGSNSCTATLTP